MGLSKRKAPESLVKLMLVNKLHVVVRPIFH